MSDLINRQAAIELFKDDAAAVNELNNLPPQPDRMKYVQEAVHTIMNTCKNDSIKDKAFRNAARLIQNAIDGEAPEFEVIEELPSAQQGWIPVMKRLPEKDGQYYVTQLRYGVYDSKMTGAYVRETNHIWYSVRHKRWSVMANCKVVAWIEELPKPWEGRQE